MIPPQPAVHRTGILAHGEPGSFRRHVFVSSHRSTGRVDMTCTAGDEAPELVVTGVVRGRSVVRVRLVVVLEPVVADDACSELFALHAVEVDADHNGRFTYRYAVPPDVRARLRGWVMCSLVAHALVPGAKPQTKVVRWQRPSSAEVITGLSVLLGTITLHADTAVRAAK
jgi:hypothetical protein